MLDIALNQWLKTADLNPDPDEEQQRLQTAAAATFGTIAGGPAYGFADATLVHLAARARPTTVVTADQSDFHIYRIDGGRRFRVLPTQRP